jgi:hypothetical protein
MSGAIVSLLLSALLCVVVSLARPQNYDWALLAHIPLAEADRKVRRGWCALTAEARMS